MSSLSRSAFSPALPTAMTTRPQLASSPAKAVLTSGELAIDSAMRLARLARGGAGDAHLDELARALAVAHDLLGEIEQHLVERARNAARRGSAASAISGRRASAAPVANISSVSEVEVSLSTVMQLNELCTRLRQQRLQGRRRDRRVGEDERQHRRHVGRDHAGALGDPVDRHFPLADLRPCAVATLGNVSVVMIALAASISASGLAPATSLSSARAMRPASRGSPITPVEAR